MNKPESDSRRIAALATVLAAVLIAVLLLLVHLRFDSEALNPSRQPVASVAEAPEFVELLQSLNSPRPSDPSQAHNSESARNASQAAPEGGVDLRDAGTEALAPPPVTSTQPSSASETERVAPQSGPTQQQIEEERSRRRAEQDMANAFNTPANDNTNSTGTTPGPSGNPSGTPTSVNGFGSGSVGGGWIMPSYAKIPSKLTGSIRLRATIDSTGRPIRVVQIGGDAPAAADAALVSMCIAEVQSQNFTRSDSAAPATATATITYIFR